MEDGESNKPVSGPISAFRYHVEDDEEEDSELSDAEAEGYCSHSSPAKIRMSLRNITRPKVKKLYNDPHKVDYL